MRLLWCVAGVGLGVQAAMYRPWFLLLLIVPAALDLVRVKAL